MLEALSTNLGEAFRRVIASLRVSSLFPALCFVFLHHYCLLPFLAAHGLPLPSADLELPALLLLTALISYILRYLNFPIIRLMEGYQIRQNVVGKKMVEWHQARHDWLMEQKKLVSKAEQRFIDDELGDYYPQREHIAPTKLGNVMAAFEAYPGRRYGIDGVYLWPRILPILDAKGYAPFVDREKEGLDFFLNFAVLSSVLAVELVTLRLLLALQPDLLGSSSRRILSWSAAIAGCLAYLFYRATIANALNWGETIKTAFDLYRYALAEQLHLKPFRSKRGETEMWYDLSSFIRGGTDESFNSFDYPPPLREETHEEQAQETTRLGKTSDKEEGNCG